MIRIQSRTSPAVNTIAYLDNSPVTELAVQRLVGRNKPPAEITVEATT